MLFYGLTLSCAYVRRVGAYPSYHRGEVGYKSYFYFIKNMEGYLG